MECVVIVDVAETTSRHAFYEHFKFVITKDTQFSLAGKNTVFSMSFTNYSGLNTQRNIFLATKDFEKF